MITGTKHYFDAPFIEEFEQQARDDESLRVHAAVLLDRLDRAPRRTAAEWGTLLNITTTWAGRGTAGGEHAAQIRQSVGTGELTMALWGITLSNDVAATFGDRFTFELLGPFPAIAASAHSDLKHEELELITGGRYKVEHTRETEQGGLVVSLRFVEVTDSTL